MKIYLASPYTKGNQADNVRAQIEAFAKLAGMGLSPFAPLLGHFVEIMAPQKYADWLRIDMEWLRVSDAVLRLPGDSDGADAEVTEAHCLGIPVYYSIMEIERAIENEKRGKVEMALPFYEIIMKESEWNLFKDKTVPEPPVQEVNGAKGIEKLVLDKYYDPSTNPNHWLRQIVSKENEIIDAVNRLMEERK